MSHLKGFIYQFVFTGACLSLLLGVPARLWSRDLVVCDDISDPATLDPQKQFSEKNHTLLQQIYEGLVRFDPDGKIEPVLAESWERIDPLRVRFSLRKGVKFHNGEPFTAEAVRYTIGRYVNPETGFPALGFISSLSHAEVVDDHTVDIITHFPDGLLLNRLAGFILVVPPGYNSKAGESAQDDFPNGTGAFRFVSWEKGKKVSLKANATYWDPRYPKVTGLEFRFMPLEDQIQALLRGEVDLVTELPGTRTTEIMSNGGNVIKKDAFYTVATTFRIDKGPLRSVLVRKALNHAINREEIIQYDLRGNGNVLSSLTMKGEIGHNPALSPYGFEIEKAKYLLKKAGYPNGIKLKGFTKVQGERAAKIMVAQLARIGVQVNLDVKTDAEVPGAINSGKYDLAIGGCPDPMAHSFFIASIFLFSKSPYSLTKSVEFDGKLMEMASTLVLKEQERLGQLLDEYVHNQALSLFSYQRLKTYGCLKNIIFKPYITGMPYFYATEVK